MFRIRRAKNNDRLIKRLLNEVKDYFYGEVYDVCYEYRKLVKDIAEELNEQYELKIWDESSNTYYPAKAEGFYRYMGIPQIVLSSEDGQFEIVEEIDPKDCAFIIDAEIEAGEYDAAFSEIIRKQLTQLGRDYESLTSEEKKEVFENIVREIEDYLKKDESLWNMIVRLVATGIAEKY